MDKIIKRFNDQMEAGNTYAAFAGIAAAQRSASSARKAKAIEDYLQAQGLAHNFVMRNNCLIVKEA